MKQILAANISFRLAACFVLLAFFVFPQTRLAGQVDEDKKAVIGINVDMVALYKNPLGKYLFDLQPAEDEMPFRFTDLKKISALISTPQEFRPEAFSSLDFYVFLGFKDSKVVAKAKAKSIEKGGQEISWGDKTVFRPSQEDFPPGTFLKFYPDSIVIGSEHYMKSDSVRFGTDQLTKVYQQLPEHPIRIAADFDGARDLLNEVAQAATESAPPQVKPFVSIIDDASAVGISVDLDDDKLLQLQLIGADGKKVQSLKLKLDALISLGKLRVTTLPIDESEMKKIQPMIDAVQKISTRIEANSVIAEIPKPDEFETLMVEAVDGGRARASAIRDVIDFRQAVLALHTFHDLQDGFPFADHVKSEDSNVGLSWKVKILPFLDADGLAGKFDYDSSFDSEINAPLGNARVEALELETGGGISWVRTEPTVNTLDDVKDGPENTIILVQNRQATSPWTRPTSISPEQVLQQFKALKADQQMIVAKYDGSVIALTKEFPLDDLNAMLHPADGKLPRSVAKSTDENTPTGKAAAPDKTAQQETEEAPKKIASEEAPEIDPDLRKAAEGVR